MFIKSSLFIEYEVNFKFGGFRITIAKHKYIFFRYLEKWKENF